MKKSIINIETLSNKKDFIKAVGFISESIIDIKIETNNLILVLDDGCDEEIINRKINDLFNRYLQIKEDDILEFNNSEKNYCEDLSLCITSIAPGMIVLKEKAVFLFNYFEKKFESFATDFGAEVKKYPVLLPISSYLKTGYLKNSPQYAYFCYGVEENMESLEKLNSKLLRNMTIKDNLQTMQFALSPSACFHTYLDYQNSVLETNKIVTFTQSVFRNEGRFNFTDKGRFRDYHVREIVFIGNSDFVNTMRSKILDKTIKFIKENNINFSLATASDPFIIPKMQKYKNIQKMEKTKYELRMNVDKDNDISVASFNIHGTAFTSPFNITIKDEENTVTGCIGYGIERWVYAFLSQFGTNEKNWPLDIYRSYIANK